MRKVTHPTHYALRSTPMDPSFFFRGVILGFSIAAPVGPIGVLCIRRSLTDGRAAGFASGLGAATADAFYGAIAAFGLTFVSAFLINQQTLLRLVGGAFLCYLGVRSFLASPAQQQAALRRTSLAGAYASTFFLTLTNPTTIFSFVAIFAGIGIASGDPNYGSAVALVLGVFVGSALWWLLLSGFVGAFRTRFSLEAMKWVNRLSGVIITSFGVIVLGSLLFQ
jgi:threonine/homoserine/homoserine lactone efflux protein